MSSSEIFSPGDIVLWRHPNLPYAYVGVILSNFDVNGRRVLAGEAPIRFWSGAGFLDDPEITQAAALTKLGTVEEWESGVYYLLDR